MNDWLESVLPLDAVLTCAHDDDDRCQCRKPLPGLITQAAEELHIECATSYMVGDRWRDVEAGRRAGCKTFFRRSWVRRAGAGGVRFPGGLPARCRPRSSCKRTHCS